MKTILFALAAASLLVVGCGETKNETAQSNAPASAPTPAAPGAAPYAGGGGADSPYLNAPLAPTPAENAKIALLEKEKNSDKALAQAYFERGYKYMNDDKAGQRVKYRAALADYRKALELDPTHENAKKNKQLIEDIYTSMGRPIPE